MTTNSRATLLLRRPAGITRRRGALLGAAALVVAVGLTVRTLPGPVGDLPGGILYAVLIFLLLALVVPAARGGRIGVAALALCVGIEILQLTGVPSAIATVVPPVRYLLGTTFVWTDLAASAVGVVLAVGIDDAVFRHGRRRTVPVDQ